MSTNVRVATDRMSQTKNTEIDHEIYRVYADVVGSLEATYQTSSVEADQVVSEVIERDVTDIASDYLQELGFTEFTDTNQEERVNRLMSLIVLTMGMEAWA
ncbi:hypothetical protein SEA_AUSTIN_98 [Gordonia phage Austin]|nr:hypothetical protein SEA_AUSTIN_98 [Gordonia phage Austin]